jgi:hypothetical protein
MANQKQLLGSNLTATDLAQAMMAQKHKAIAITTGNLKYPTIQEFIEEDGIKHINISVNGKTELGKKLDIFYHAPFPIERDGTLEEYNCLSGFWYYLTTLNEDFKKLSGKACLLKGKTEEKINTLPSNFQELFCNALLSRILSDENLVEELINSTLPFKYYFIKYDKKTKKAISKHNVAYAPWYIKALSKIRNTLKVEKNKDEIQKILTPYFKTISSIK